MFDGKEGLDITLPWSDVSRLITKFKELNPSLNKFSDITLLESNGIITILRCVLDGKP